MSLKINNNTMDILDFANFVNENYNKFPVDASEYWEYGSLNAVIHNNFNNIANWLNKYGDYDKTDEILLKLQEIGTPIGCLSNINVEEDYKGEGRGNEILEYFVDVCIENDVKAIILIADLDEQQTQGFDLVKWYESKGFKIINYIYNNPVMVMLV